jgi:signal transduction histidine kinase
MSEEPATIGRSSAAIQLSDDTTSRRHAEVRSVNGGWMLTDLNSSNGTYINGKRVTKPVTLRHGDQIKVGSTLLVFSGEDRVNSYSGPEAAQHLIEWEGDTMSLDTTILSSIDPSQDSAIFSPLESAEAIVAWNVVYKVAEAVGTIESVEPFLERLCDILFNHLVADHLVLLMRDETTGLLQPQLVRHRGNERDRQPRIVTSRTIIDHVVKTKGAVRCANAQTDGRFGGDRKADSVHRLGLRSVLCVPIIAHDEVHGILHMDCSMSRHTYSQEQLRLVVAVGRLAGVAIENARLLESRMRTARLAATGETVAYLSHHIRNILQGMQGGADMVEIALRKQDWDLVTSGWCQVRRNLERTLQLAMNMLTFSKDRQPMIEPTQLNLIVEDVVALVQNRAREKGVTIVPDLEDLPVVPLDAEGMHQVAHNLLINAVDAAPERSGWVRVKTHLDAKERCVLLTISDNGPGIPAEEHERIFNAFHSSKGQAGTGLGLAAARKIVGELNGRIDLECRPGSGATFHVRVPATREPVTDGQATRSTR